jgi:hypothetical protein
LKENEKPTFTYRLDPESIRVERVERVGKPPAPKYFADVSYLQYGGDAYELRGGCSVEYSFCDDLLMIEETHIKGLNDAAKRIVLDRLHDLGKAVLMAGGEVPCPGCWDYSCPTHGCPPEKLLTRRQVAERNLREGKGFIFTDETDEQWEAEKAKWLAVLAEEDAKK